MSAEVDAASGSASRYRVLRPAGLASMGPHPRKRASRFNSARPGTPIATAGTEGLAGASRSADRIRVRVPSEGRWPNCVGDDACAGIVVFIKINGTWFDVP